MARTLKKFETEAQFEAWKNSPQMRTPYTCLVTDTGAVHYDEGSDDDYSITAVIKKTCWVKLGTPALVMKAIDSVYLNGVEVNIDELPGGESSSYYYRHESDRKNPSFKYEDKEDFEYDAGVSGDDEIQTRGGVYMTGPDEKIMNYLPRRFAKGHINHSKYEFKKFLYVKKGDTLKIVFNSGYIELLEGYRYKLFGSYNDDDFMHPKLFSLHRISKEIVIGDGFTEINGRLLRLYKCPKVYFGKKIKKIYDFDGTILGHYGKRKTFIRKNTQIIGRETPIRNKIIRM